MGGSGDDVVVVNNWGDYVLNFLRSGSVGHTCHSGGECVSTCLKVLCVCVCVCVCVYAGEYHDKKLGMKQKSNHMVWFSYRNLLTGMVFSQKCAHLE